MTIEMVLDRCLEAIHCENWTIAECLERYPEYADELGPLLATALEIEDLPDIKPSEEFKQATRERLLHIPGPTGDGRAGEQASRGTVTFREPSTEPSHDGGSGRPRGRRPNK